MPFREPCLRSIGHWEAGFWKQSIYQESLELEMAARHIPFVAQQELQLEYKGKTLRQTYKPDFICYGSIIVELKTCSNLASDHVA